MSAKVIVTGGGGFLGKALAFKLKALGHSVLCLARRSYPELAAGGIESRQVDLASRPEDVAPHFRGAEAVFHTAARVGMWGRYEEFLSGNVTATRNVIAACRAHGVPHLIYTSSPSVVADGRSLCGIDESYPYPRRHNAHYPATKMLAEQEVRAASGTHRLKTICLRPHLIFGPGDTNLVPTIIARAEQGRLVRVGAGRNRTDVTFIGDCVAAHLCAWQALLRRPELGGRCYFISQGEPVNMWEWIGDILSRRHLPPPARSIPVPLAKSLAALCELKSALVGGDPLLTRFLVSEMSTDHFFNIAAARRDLGYHPGYSVRQAMEATFGEDWR